MYKLLNYATSVSLGTPLSSGSQVVAMVHKHVAL